MFIDKNHRNSQNGTALLNMVEMAAKEIHGCKYLTTTISRHFGKPETTLKICEKRGFGVLEINEDAIILKKEL